MNWQDQLDVDPHPDGVTIWRKRRPGDVLEDGEGIRVPMLLMDSDPPDRPVYGRFNDASFSAWAARGALLKDAWKSPDQIYDEAQFELRQLRHDLNHAGVTPPPVHHRGYVQAQDHPVSLGVRRDHPGHYDAAGVKADVDRTHYRRDADAAWEERGELIRNAWRTP